MKLANKFSVLLLIIIVSLSAVTFSYAVNVPERPYNYVVDLAGVVENNTEMKLNRYLQELEVKTTAQMAILTIKSLEGESIEDFSITVAHDKWKLGQKGKDNGVLLLISVKDRKYRIEVGYGLEGVLPDSLVGSIGRNYLVPYFRKGDYSKGIYTATLAIANEIASEYGKQITGMPKLKRSIQSVKKDQTSGFLKKIFSLVFFIVLLLLFIKNPRLLLVLLLFSSMGGRSSWGGGGGFGGGSGGFGGGGGGFGGGGASGGW
jgi:uncharacterized protein